MYFTLLRPYNIHDIEEQGKCRLDKASMCFFFFFYISCNLFFFFYD